MKKIFGEQIELKNIFKLFIATALLSAPAIIGTKALMTALSSVGLSGLVALPAVGLTSLIVGIAVFSAGALISEKLHKSKNETEQNLEEVKLSEEFTVKKENIETHEMPAKATNKEQEKGLEK